MSTRRKHLPPHRPPDDKQSPPEEKKKTEVRHSEDKVAISRREYEDLLARAEEAAGARDRMLRALAEVENDRKRLDREKKDYLRFANEGLVSELLPVLDNFDRALKTPSSSSEDDSYRQGVEMIYRQLKSVLEKQGLKEIKAEGQPFDPFFHEAVQEEETDEYPEGTVLEELQKGYLFQGRLLRPTVVKVSR